MMRRLATSYIVAKTLDLAALAVLALLSPTSAHAAENRVSFRGDVHISSNEVVDSAASVMGSVTVDGTVRQSAVSVFGDVTIGATGSVGGDAVSVGGTVYRVGGSAVGGHTRAIPSPGHALGRLFVVGLPMAAAAAALTGAVLIAASSVGFLVLVVVILVLFEPQVAEARQVMQTAPLQSFVLGVIGFLAFLPLVIFLGITVIGIPLALAVGAVGMAAICLGAVAGCEWLGRELSRRFHRPLAPLWSGLLGLAVMFLLGFVPLLGHAIHAAVVLTGLGAVMQTRFRGPARRPD
jgi:hypothetical protein